MRSLSIKAKVTMVIVLCLAAGAALLAWLVQQSYDQNVQLVARQALDSARKTYKNLEEDDYRAIGLASTALQTNGRLKELYMRRDREAFVKAFAPFFNDLKKQFGISLLILVEPEPSKKVFVRMNTPEKYGDVYKQEVFDRAIKTKNPAAGSELGLLGYALRCASPMYDDKGKCIGYMILGDTYDNFLSAMHKQSGDEYLMVGQKSLLDEKRYRTGQQRKKVKDYWDEFKDVVVLSATTEDHGKASLDKELEKVPESGKILGTSDKSGKTYVRAVFPLVDSTGKRIGGVFVTHDISALHDGMAATRTSAIGAIIGLILLITLAIVLILNKLVFARLNRTMDVATRVVGGEFETQIVPGSDDEVGRLESLLEQFRAVFVNVVHELEDLQDRKKAS